MECNPPSPAKASKGRINTRRAAVADSIADFLSPRFPLLLTPSVIYKAKYPPLRILGLQRSLLPSALLESGRIGPLLSLFSTLAESVPLLSMELHPPWLTKRIWINSFYRTGPFFVLSTGLPPYLRPEVFQRFEIFLFNSNFCVLWDLVGWL